MKLNFKDIKRIKWKKRFEVDKLMHEINLRQAGVIYSACGPFTKDNERVKEIKEARDSRYVYESKQNKAYPQDDMTY